MSCLVKSKNITIDKNKLANHSIGNFYSNDRFYTLLNMYIDNNLSRKSKTLGFIVKYLFKSSNYKHDTEIANKKSKLTLIVDIICWLCMIGFISMVISVIGISLDSIPTDTSLSGIAAFGKGFIESLSKNIVMLIFAIIFFIISLLWLIVFFKIRRKNAKLTLKDYVIKKINTVLRLRFLIKVTSKTTKSILGTFKQNKNVEIICLDMFESQGSNSDIWLNLQMINLLVSIFDDFNLLFKFDQMTNDQYAELNKICSTDFLNIEIVNF